MMRKGIIRIVKPLRQTVRVSILTKPEENLALSMKDGKIYKNTTH